jgi:hypothetical protein
MGYPTFQTFFRSGADKLSVVTNRNNGKTWNHRSSGASAGTEAPPEGGARSRKGAKSGKSPPNFV